MKEEYTKTNSKIINKNNNHIKNRINNKYEKVNNTIMNYLYLILIIILIIIIIVFLFLYIPKMKTIKAFAICDDGFFLPKDDKTKCIKCSIKNCNKCNPSFYPFYEDNKILSCSICNEGYYY